MRFLFSCGGTAGHINPAIAVANIWKERYPDSKILFIGGVGNMEEELVPKAGYELVTFPASGMSRGKSLSALTHNVRAVCVAPGPVLTRPGMANMKTMAGRAAEPHEITDFIMYLASEKGAFVNGTYHLIDGGRNVLHNK